MFSLAGETHPFPLQRLVENRARLDVWALQKAGALMPGAETAITLNEKHGGALRPLPGGQIQIELGASTVEVSLAEDVPMRGVRRSWFQCPACERRARHLYLPQLLCRRCLQLEHVSRHSGRWGNGRQRFGRWGNIHRIAWLRRRLGVDPAPFAPIPPPQRRRGRYWRLTRRIELEEAKLLAGTHRFAERCSNG
jgi:hypothetical protein